MFEAVFAISQIDEGNLGNSVRLDLTADRDACAMLARRFDWIEVCSVVARLEIKMTADNMFLVTGRIEARLIQRCRLSGNPVRQAVVIAVEERFADPAVVDDMGVVDSTGAIDPLAVSVEPLEDGCIPVGEMIAQLIGLEASPWPRDPKADEDVILQSSGDEPHPFASLAELKKNR